MFNLTAILRARGAGSRGERRIHNQARALWESVRNGHDVPLLSSFSIAKANAISAHGFLLDVTFKGNPLVLIAGDVLWEEAGLAPVPTSLAKISARSLLGQFADRWREAVLTREPMTSEYEFTTPEMYKVLCRGVLLPLSTDGSTIDHVYGVVSWKSKKIDSGQEAPAAKGRPIGTACV